MWATSKHAYDYFCLRNRGLWFTNVAVLAKGGNRSKIEQEWQKLKKKLNTTIIVKTIISTILTIWVLFQHLASHATNSQHFGLRRGLPHTIIKKEAASIASIDGGGTLDLDFQGYSWLFEIMLWVVIVVLGYWFSGLYI